MSTDPKQLAADVDLWERRVSALLEGVTKAEAELRAAKDVANEARTSLRAARIAADSILPTATVSSTRLPSYKVAIVRRTASTIYTRGIGDQPDDEKAWRERKYTAGTWHQYPRSDVDRWRVAPTLTIDADSAREAAAAVAAEGAKP